LGFFSLVKDNRRIDNAKQSMCLLLVLFLFNVVHVRSTSVYAGNAVIIKQSNSRYVIFNNNSRD